MASIVSRWQLELIETYPDLFQAPPGGPEAAQGYPACGSGWRDLLDCCCVRIRAELSEDQQFRFLEIKEKSAGLRIYWTGRLSLAPEQRIRQAIDLAEARAGCTCEVCGEEGRLHRRGDWLSTRCAHHAEGQPVDSRRGYENLHLVQRFIDGRLRSVTCARYDRQSDSFIDVPPASRGFKE